MTTYFELEADAERAIDERLYAYFETALVDGFTGTQVDPALPAPSLVWAKGTIVGARRKLPDLFFFIGAKWLLISNSSLEIIDEHRCCSSISWKDTLIYDKNGVELSKYNLAYNAIQHDVWDWKRSDCAYLPGKTPGVKEDAGYMRKGVLNESAVPDFDLFHAERGYWIVSDRLRSSLISADVTGFVFEECQC